MKNSIFSIVVAAFVAAVIVFFVGFVMFNVVPLPTWFTQALPDDHSAVEALSELETGTYQYPNPRPQGETAAETAVQQMAEGPMLTIYLREGQELNLGLTLAEEFARAFLASLILCFLLAVSHSSLCCYAYRVFFVALIGCFAAVSNESTYSIWYFRSCGTTTWMYIATIVGWTLAGFAVAALVKPLNFGPKNSSDSVV